MFLGHGQVVRVEIFSGPVSTPFLKTTWPRYLTNVQKYSMSQRTVTFFQCTESSKQAILYSKTNMALAEETKMFKDSCCSARHHILEGARHI